LTHYEFVWITGDLYHPLSKKDEEILKLREISVLKSMTKEERFLIHSKHIKRTFVLLIIGWIAPIVSFLIKDENEHISLYSFMPTLIFLLIAIIIDLRRRFILRKLFYVKLNIRKVYEMEKRRSKNNLYNLRWLLIISFFDGDFQKAIICADEILSMTSKKKYVECAIFYKILSYFLTENTDTALFLIEKQKHYTKGKKRNVMLNRGYYDFIEAFIAEEYDEALDTIRQVLIRKNSNAQNIDKVLVNYLMRMAFLNKGDLNNAQNCTVEILVADKQRNTYFSRNLHNTIYEIRH